MRVGVITFPGSLDERDAQRAVKLAGGTPVALWHGAHDLEGVEAIILPGGFSYGDYLRDWLNRQSRAHHGRGN
jgi:phosphoribosylformylglycinamidine synthase